MLYLLRYAACNARVSVEDIETILVYIQMTPRLCEPTRRACEAVLALSAHLSDDDFGRICMEPKKTILGVINERAEKEDWFSVWTIMYNSAYLAESRTDAARFFTDDIMKRLAYLCAYCDPYYLPEVRNAAARIRLAVNRDS